mmetsp:Transcript_21772/g.36012  ORF Transcript_21772/g.36012 Transcript_21772/m.36012 type:complete len:227 (-) Transcript_21772:209-889(-)|eukprot:CAMPEP_0184657044 /NCGR_PEP_ID=MMETSP0308-20130426/16934_1 /TAXON_ID=38269 /ORGANISM="Gloeochaete witrockiana, Strain SAG 46.84" /LENGTH=226 /DNA_ID=CAMNT_0027094425 /DNA_START=180 /DNA_END=860 /DNA_ORIENTATION=+
MAFVPTVPAGVSFVSGGVSLKFMQCPLKKKSASSAFRYPPKTLIFKAEDQKKEENKSEATAATDHKVSVSPNFMPGFPTFFPTMFPRWTDPVFHEMDRAFEDIWSLSPQRMLSTLEQRTRIPTMGFRETDESNVIEIQVPGVEEKDISVEIRGDTLSVQAERKTDCENVSFMRKACLPLFEGVKKEEVKCVFKDGVLTVTLPKPAEPRQKSFTVPISSGLIPLEVM